MDAKTRSGILDHTKASFPLDTYANVTDDIQRQAAQPGHWNRVLPAMILTGTVLGGTAHGIRFQIKNLYTC